MEQIPAEELSDRQLLLAILRRITTQGENMSELETSVSALQTAVADLGGRILPQIADLEAALAVSQQAQADLQTALTTAAAQDVAEDAAFQQNILDLQAALDAANADVTTQVGRINESVGTLNTLGQPVVEPPVEPPAA